MFNNFDFKLQFLGKKYLRTVVRCAYPHNIYFKLVGAGPPFSSFEPSRNQNC
jgi:hypothetical protein